MRRQVNDPPISIGVMFDQRHSAAVGFLSETATTNRNYRNSSYQKPFLTGSIQGGVNSASLKQHDAHEVWMINDHDF